MVTPRQQQLLDHGPAAAQALTGTQFNNYLHHASHLDRYANWEAARDVELADQMQLTIAAHAALLGAGMTAREHPFSNVAAIIIHRGAIRSHERAYVGRGGGIVRRSDIVVGLSSPGHGPLVLDWRTIERQVDRPQLGTNVIYHEFAHKLDQLNGAADGMPPLPSRDDESAWAQTLGVNFRRLRRRGSDGLIRNYGATNEGEYFAVVSEVFFTRPVALQRGLPRLYERLASFYRQDPAARLVAGG